MRFSFILGVAGLVLVGCGGSTSQEPSTGGSAGSGASAGSAGSGASSGFGGVGNSGGVGGGSGGATGGAGGGVGGSTGGAGGAQFCCSSDLDCPVYNGQPGAGSECINGVCKDIPPAGTCWADKDCGDVPGACQGGSVCPCGADCYAADSLGKCNLVGPGCCTQDSDCTQKPNVPLTCVAGNCEKVPPSGQCWSDLDCNGGTCAGACVCPCGSVCACGGQMGWCTSTVPACCTSSAACGAGSVCANNVCKKSEPPYCWADEECPNGQKCVGATVCPCGALCAIADNPGKCQ